MNIDSSEFKEKLKKLCETNWKAKAIMKDKTFTDLPDFQQKMFLKYMEIDKVEVTINAR